MLQRASLPQDTSPDISEQSIIDVLTFILYEKVKVTVPSNHESKNSKIIKRKKSQSSD